jgi:pyruvate formate lyase activating enzyme
MIIGALQRFSLLDYPGRIAAIVFTQGCDFRCPFCFNRELVLEEYFRPPIPEAELFDFLRCRTGLLEAVVVTGGEPTVHTDLPAFLGRIKALGYLVKLDTNGSHPEMLREIIDGGAVDYIAMDVKAPWHKYEQLCGVAVGVEKVRESVELIAHSGLEQEFRTAVAKTLLSEADLAAIGELLKDKGPWHLQPFLPTDTVLDPSLRGRRTRRDRNDERRRNTEGSICRGEP